MRRRPALSRRGASSSYYRGITSIPSVRKKRENGIEPSLVAWEATVLPLNYSRKGVKFRIPNVEIRNTIESPNL